MNENWTSAVHPRKCGRTAVFEVLSKSHDIKSENPDSDSWDIVVETVFGLFEERVDEFRDEDLSEFLMMLSSQNCQLLVSVLGAMVKREVPEGISQSPICLLNPSVFYRLILPQDSIPDDYFDTIMPQIQEIVPQSLKHWQASQLDDFLSFLVRKLSDYENLSTVFFTSMAHLLLELMNRDWGTLERVLASEGESLFTLLQKCSLENITAARSLSERAAQFAKGKWIRLTLSRLFLALSSEVSL